MRFHPIILLSLLITACSSGPSPKEETNTAIDTVAAAPIEWTGYYTGTLPCADCPGIETTLWVRSDSTFVLQQQGIDRDSVRTGTIGNWSVANGVVELADRIHVIRRLASVQGGLEWLDEDGEPMPSGSKAVLEKLADAIGDAIPRMRVTGTFTYMADAQSFKPCGIDYAWPCAGGMDMGEEEGEPLIEFTNEDLQKAYAKAVKKGGDPWVVEVVCTMGMGPAAEGDGADEYIFIEQVIGTAGERCP